MKYENYVSLLLPIVVIALLAHFFLKSKPLFDIFFLMGIFVYGIILGLMMMKEYHKK